MGTRNVKLLSIAALVIVLLVATSLADRPSQPENGNIVYSLQAPSFLGAAHADEQAILSVIGDEAGIAAYFQAATPIDMVSVKDSFRTIEAETADYIIGSVEVMNYPESEDVHVYVHRDGWILAYYLAADPVGKTYDWHGYYDSGQTILTTKLEKTLIKVAGYAVVSYPGCTYYDFRYPNATHLMLIADWVQKGADSFQVELPGSFIFAERSWSLGSDDCASYKLDSVIVLQHGSGGGWRTSQGTFTAAQLLPQQMHTINVEGSNCTYPYGSPGFGFAGLALIYGVP